MTEQPKRPRPWFVLAVVTASTFAGIAAADAFMEAQNDRLLFAKAKEICAGGVAVLDLEGNGGRLDCR